MDSDGRTYLLTAINFQEDFQWAATWHRDPAVRLGSFGFKKVKKNLKAVRVVSVPRIQSWFKVGITIRWEEVSNEIEIEKVEKTSPMKLNCGVGSKLALHSTQEYQAGSPVSFACRFVSVLIRFTVPGRYGSCRFGFYGSVRFAGTLLTGCWCSEKEY